MPVDRDFLHKQINTIVDDLLDLIDAAQKSPRDIVKINGLLKQVRDNANGLRQELGPLVDLKDLGDKDVFKVSALSDALDQINPTRATDMGLDNFLGTMANSLIAAQTDLNEKSRAYSQNVLTQFKGFFPPAQFLIPTVKAEMTVGVTDASEKTINLILIKDSETKTNYAESKISFELTAAPPPPGATLDLNLFTVLQGKLAFLAEVEKLAGVSAAVNLDKTKHFALVFSVPKASAPNNDENVFMVLYLIQDQDQPILSENWKTMVAVGVQRSNGKLGLYNQLFQGDVNPATFPKTQAVKNFPFIAFGDVLMQIVAALYQWSASLGFPPEAS